jgi:hypothetical protein
VILAEVHTACPSALDVLQQWSFAGYTNKLRVRYASTWEWKRKIKILEAVQHRIGSG